MTATCFAQSIQVSAPARIVRFFTLQVAPLPFSGEAMTIPLFGGKLFHFSSPGLLSFP